MANARDELQTLLHSLNLTAMADAAHTTALRAAKEGLTHEAYLLELGRIELAAKTSRRTERLRKQSGLLGGRPCVRSTCITSTRRPACKWNACKVGTS
jgi:hypothetical protein